MTFTTPTSRPEPDPFDAIPTCDETRGDHAGFPGRLEDYAELRCWGLAVDQAAARIGVTERTGWRYERRLRGMAA